MKIYGLIGYPVKHSLSPIIHNTLFQELGIDAEYRLFEITPEKLEDFLLKDIIIKDTEGKEFSSQEIIGFNITIPHKVSVLGFKGYACQLDLEVSLAGAANTVRREDKKLLLRNTDCRGFIKSLSQDLSFNPGNKNIFIAGCGGAGRAVIASLIPRSGLRVKKLYIYDVHKETALSVEKHFRGFEWIGERLEVVLDKDKIAECDLLVNASSLGMKEGEPSPVDKNLLHKDLSIYDVVYNHETQLIKDAQSLGLKAIAGLGMLLYQGIASFEFWTGKIVPPELIARIRGKLEKELKK